MALTGQVACINQFFIAYSKSTFECHLDSICLHLAFIPKYSGCMID